MNKGAFVKRIKNRRPKLKRMPTFADTVAEIIRSAADAVQVQVSVRVILHRRGRDLILLTVNPPAKDRGPWWMGLDRVLCETRSHLRANRIFDRVTFDPYREAEVWISADVGLI